MRRLIELSHLDLCFLQNPIFIARGSEGVNKSNRTRFGIQKDLKRVHICVCFTCPLSMPQESSFGVFHGDKHFTVFTSSLLI